MICKIYDFYVLNYMYEECKSHIPPITGLNNVYEQHLINFGTLLVDIGRIICINEISNFWLKCNPKIRQSYIDSINSDTIYNILMDLHPICNMIKEPKYDISFPDYVEGLELKYVKKILKRNVELNKFIDNVKFLFLEQGWDKNYGGKKWFQIAECLLNLSNELNNPINNSKITYYIDICISLAHNTGNFLSKSPQFPKNDLKIALDELHSNTKSPLKFLSKCQIANRFEYVINLLTQKELIKMIEDTIGINNILTKSHLESTNKYIESCFSEINNSITNDVTQHIDNIKNDIQVNQEYINKLQTQSVSIENNITQLTSILQQHITHSHNISNSTLGLLKDSVEELKHLNTHSKIQNDSINKLLYMTKEQCSINQSILKSLELNAEQQLYNQSILLRMEQRLNMPWWKKIFTKNIKI